jgi:hypothetical protein
VPTVVFLANVLGPEKRVELSEATDLVDVCDNVLAPIPFSCRSKAKSSSSQPNPTNASFSASSTVRPAPASPARFG